MPIKNHPFIDPVDGCLRPMLWVRVTNPHTHIQNPPVLAIVDTGADECALPAEIAFRLGHTLDAVPRKEVMTAGGKTWAYSHTSTIEVLDRLPDGRPANNVLYTIPNKTIDFTVGLKSFILGTKHFLDQFVLRIDYTQRIFSIRTPQPQTPKKHR